MLRRPLIALISTAAFLLIAINLLISLWSQRLPYSRAIEHIRDASQCNLLLIGNSLLDQHVDENSLTRAAAERGAVLDPLNAALGASQPPEQRLLFDYSLEHQAQVRMVAVGIFDFQLTAEDHSHPLDLTGNRVIGLDRRIEYKDVAETYGFGLRDRIELTILRHFPMAAYRTNAWRYVELLRRAMGANGLPQKSVNSMGRVDDFAALEASSVGAFDAEAQEFLSNPMRFNSSYEEIFSDAERKNIKPIIILMPMPPLHRRTYYDRPSWKAYMAALTSLANRRGISVLDASGWFSQPDDFVDHLHVSQGAAREFSYRLGLELAPALQSAAPQSIAFAGERAPAQTCLAAAAGTFSSPAACRATSAGRRSGCRRQM